MAREFSPTTKKVLLLLAGGVGLGLARTPRQYFRVIGAVHQEWQKINRRQLNQAIKSLYRSKLVSILEQDDGAIRMIVNDAGRKKALVYKLDDMVIKHPKRWDGWWRLVVFDIPERHRQTRGAIRDQLKNLGFYQYQKSVFVLPYECRNEIDFIVELFEVRPYVRYVVAKHLDNELHLKKLFDLI